VILKIDSPYLTFPICADPETVPGSFIEPIFPIWRPLGYAASDDFPMLANRCVRSQLPRRDIKMLEHA